METFFLFALPTGLAIISGLLLHLSVKPLFNLLGWLASTLSFICFFTLILFGGAEVLVHVFAVKGTFAGMAFFLFSAVISGLLTTGIANMTNHVYLRFFQKRN